MKKMILSLISLVAAILAVVSLHMVVSTMAASAKAQNTFDKLAAQVEREKQKPNMGTQHTESAGQEPVEDAVDPETGMLRGYAEIYKENPDLFGWIRIDDTPIDYPVMYTPDDPQYYLHRSFEKKKTDSGTPFMDAACSEGCGNYIIYGHNMKNGSMFHEILKYADKKYWEEHRMIRFDTLYAQGEYEVIAAFYGQAIAEGTPGFRYYQYSDLTDPEQFEEFTTQLYRAAEYDTGLRAEYGDQLITLSTCSYHTTDGRFAVVARRKQ